MLDIAERRVIAPAGTGKTTATATATAAWEAAGYRVVGCAPSGVAADELGHRAGMSSETIARTFLDIARGQGMPADGVLVVDEAGMVGTRDMARLLDAAAAAGTKVVLVGDPDQLQPVAAGGMLRAIEPRTGSYRLETNRRQREGWQRDSAEDISAGRGAEALDRYVVEGRVTVADSPMAARAACVADWWKVAQGDLPGTLMEATSNANVEALNSLAQQVRREAGQLSGEATLTKYAQIQVGDRIICRSNSKRYDVRNGHAGTVVATGDGGLVADMDAGRQVTLPAKYATEHVQLGYARTVYKTQGVTAGQTFVYGIGSREAAYTALSRHTDDCRIYLSNGSDNRSDLDLPQRAQVDAIRQAKLAIVGSEAKLAASEVAPKSLTEAELLDEVQRTTDLLRVRPPAGVPVSVLVAEVEHLQADIGAERERLDQVVPARKGLLRRSEAEPSREALERLETHLEVAVERLSEAEQANTRRREWDGDRKPELARGVVAGDELSWRRQAKRIATEAPVLDRSVEIQAPTRSLERVRSVTDKRLRRAPVARAKCHEAGQVAGPIPSDRGRRDRLP